MESVEQNKLLTEVGKGKPMGELMRRYWQPIGAAIEMENKWTKRIRLLGEDLVLFKDRQGRLGLIAEQCPHRRASFAHGIPTENGIRCPYHGWEYNAQGKCINQPNELDKCAFRDKVSTDAYPVEEMGGMLFAYMVPNPNRFYRAGMALWPRAPFASWAALFCPSTGCKSWRTRSTPCTLNGCTVIIMSFSKNKKE